jgi:membrane protease YdiL (CAAX protease family)
VRTRLSAWAVLVAALVALAYADRFAAGKPDREVLYRYSTAVGSAFVYALIVGSVFWIASPRFDLLALRRPRSWAAAAGLGLVLLVGVYLAVAVLDQVLHGGREQGLTPPGWEPSHALQYAANFVVVAGVAPFVEELTFRGLGFSLLERYGRWTAIVAVGVLFALAHGLVQALPELALFGCALAWLRWRTGSVVPGMVLHASFNAISLITAVTVGH